MNYDKQAQDFLNKNGITFESVCLGSCFKWDKQRFRYLITLTRINRKGETLTFESPFYGSSSDYQNKIKKVTAYDFLSAISGNNFTSANEIIREFGQDTSLDIDAILQEARNKRKFFTRRMLLELDEIQ